jgi:uncharacterized repeat protein (TIGR01451 family)
MRVNTQAKKEKGEEMKSKTAFTITLGALLFVMTFMALHIPLAKAQQTPVFTLSSSSPPEVSVIPSTTTPSAGVPFTVSVYVSSTVELDLFAWQINMTWDPTVLDYSGFNWGESFVSPPEFVTVGPMISVSSDTGQLLIGETCINRIFYGQVTSPLLLFTVTFKGISGGPTSINLANAELFGISDDGIDWQQASNQGIPRYTEYDKWPDVNKDGAINIYDAILVANHWGQAASSSAGAAACDFNEDGFVDTFDFAIVAADFTKTSSDQTWPGNSNSGPHYAGYTNTVYEFNAVVQSGSVTVPSGMNMYLSMNAPVSMDRGSAMTYTLYYTNFGDTAADNVVLKATLSSDVEFVSASDSGTYSSGTVTWSIGTVPGYPSGQGSTTVVVQIPSNVALGTVITTTAYVSTTTIETSTDDNGASAQTTVTGVNLPQGAGVTPTIGTTGDGTPMVFWQTPITFKYTDSTGTATSVSISVQMDDGTWITSPTGDSMTQQGSSSAWTYTISMFYPNHGKATVTYTVTYPSGSPLIVSFDIYVDPAGYVYDTTTLKRIAGATVWLQRPDGQGGWENVPTGQTPPIMQPDVNPQTTGADGQFQWDVLNGSYRVYVEALGYYSADSILVNVPPPVTDLAVGLAPTNAHDVAVTDVTADRAWIYQGFSANINVTVANQGNYTETFNTTAYANGTIIGSENVTLPAGNSTTVTFTWNVTGFAYGKYTLSAIAWPVPGETNTANNDFTGWTVEVTILGDVNDDGTVNILDAIKIARAFGATPGSSNWNPNADINGDGVVNILDAIALAKTFGATIA